MHLSDAPSACLNARATKSRPAAVAGDSLRQTRCNCSTRRQAAGRSDLAMAMNASTSARKNSEVSAGTDALASEGLRMGRILRRHR